MNTCSDYTPTLPMPSPPSTTKTPDVCKLFHKLLKPVKLNLSYKVKK